ncbi:hypothetical protein LIP_2873 [Limnochorda pilosa]|uniref:PorV/PorQ family protein n=1 Tax=Limnochorda pilosa TaxID=1555112 RepID=A0A0K2SNY5_LIMPI|nr:hypothetical protein LIP_2873 [Limnochorda pilosa]
MARLFIVALVAGSPTRVALAQDLAATAAFLDLGLGARTMAMGGASVAVVDGAAALRDNPAGLAQLRGLHFTSFYSTEYGLSSLGAAALAAPSFGLGATYFLSPDNQVRDDPPAPASDTFDVTSLAATAGVGARLGPLALGVSLTHVRHALYQTTGTGLTGSAGLLLQAGPLRVGVVGRHLFGEMTYASTADPFDPVYAAGFALMGREFVVTGEYEVPGSEDRSGGIARAGLEVRLGRLLDLRAGAAYQVAQDLLDPSAGIGIHLGGLRLDYAYTLPAVLPETHRLALAVRF